MIGLVVMVIMSLGAVFVALQRPGVGIGIALALGRHFLPDRVTPLVAAAPLFCLAAYLGLVISGRRPRVTPASMAAATMVALVVLVGGFREQANLNELVGLLSRDKAFFLAVALIPLLLLTPALERREILDDFLFTLVAVPALLALLLIATGGGERAGALGGGPITLSTACGFGIIIVLYQHERFFPPLIRPFESIARGVLLLIFFVGMVLTESRQPVLSLIVVLGIATLLGARKDVRNATTPKELRRARWVRVASMAGVVVVVGVLVRLIFYETESRYSLLSNPGQEITRSRWFSWEAGINKIYTSGPFGHGFSTTADNYPIWVDYPHNLFIELFAEVGPFVAVMVVAMLGVGAVRAVREGTRVFNLLAGYAFLGTQISGDLYNSRYLFVFLLASPIVGRAMRSPFPGATLGRAESQPSATPVMAARS